MSHYPLGLEFTVQASFLKSHGIHLFHTKTGIKASKAERCIQTILTKIHKLMYMRHTPNWIDTLAEVESSYNLTKTPTLLNFCPQDIVKDPKKRLALSKHYALERLKHHKRNEKRRRKLLSKNSNVRVVKIKKVFDKSYGPKFSEKTYKIIKVNHWTIPETYKINDDTGRNYYREELSEVGDLKKTAQKDLYIDGQRKVQSRLTRSGKKYNFQTEYKLKSISNPSEVSWISEDELLTLKKKKLIE